MKISGNNEIAKYVNEATTDRTQETANNASRSIDATSKVERGTVVNLSQKSRDVQIARKAIEAQPDVRSEKVQAITDKIENGTYVVNHNRTAEKMAQAFFEEMA